MPCAVVDLLEAVEVEEDESQPAAVAPRTRRLPAKSCVKGLVVQEACEGVAPRALGQISGHPGDVRGHAALEGMTCLAFPVLVEDSCEDEELRDDLARREAEAFPLPGEVLGERRRV